MDIMDEVLQSAKQAFEIAGQKTGEAIEVGRLQIKAAQLQSDVRKLYEQIGNMIYVSRQNGSDPTAIVDSLIGQIDRLSEEIHETTARIQSLRQLVKCPRCGAQNHREYLYCSRCGAPLPQAEPASEAGPEQI